MKQLIKYMLSLALLLIGICGCNHQKQEKLSGHIVFLHIGEENYTIWPLLVVTGGDSSYLEYKKLNQKQSRENFVLTVVFPRDRITVDSDSLLYKRIKGYLISNKKLRYINRTPESMKLAIGTMRSGTFKVIIHDNRDSLGLVVPHGQVAQAIFSELLKITQKYNNEDLSQKLSQYEGMQSVWVDNKK